MNNKLLEQIARHFNGHLVLELYVRWDGIEYICRMDCQGCALNFKFPEYFLDYPVCIQ